MAKWLYNLHGHPIAFVNGDKVFSKKGSFIGRLDAMRCGTAVTKAR